MSSLAEEIKKSLRRLVDLKVAKNDNGKTDQYLTEMPLAWDEAVRVLEEDTSVPKYGKDELIRRAMRTSIPQSPGEQHPRWVGVMETFACGSGVAHNLCLEYGLDPDEMQDGPTCEVCESREDDEE